MSQVSKFWELVGPRLENDELLHLLIVAESSGSSPGRAGYKMAVAADGALYGSIGGGLMEVNLVERARAFLSEPGAVATGSREAKIIEQVHRKNAPNASGMICSGRQTVISKLLTSEDLPTVLSIVGSLNDRVSRTFEISNSKLQIIESPPDTERHYFSKASETDFVYRERLGWANEIVIVGGGHCALALSEMMSKLDFHVRIFDDRPDLNTIQKNKFADEVTIVDHYENIGEYIPNDREAYLVVMTLGYASDAVVIRQLIDREFKYFGVLGSRAKMATLFNELRDGGVAADKLARIRTPIGLPINSRTPEEIAVSIAAEIIALKNA